jgi:phosphoglycolate phosphatase
MDPQTGETVADSLFAAGNAAEIAAHMVLHGSLVPRDELTAELDRIFADGAENPVPVCDLPAVMRKLRGAGFRIGIASSDNERAVRRSAEKLAIVEFIDFYAGYDSGHGPKPQPGMIHGFCATVGVDAAAVAMIGDNRHDMVMARAAGAGAAVSVLSGTGTRETLGDIADICIASVEHLPALLARG